MPPDEPRPPSGHFTTLPPRDHWYVACTSRELRARPVRRLLFGMPVVLFRDATGRAAALLDRCAHRNVPLSEGGVVAGALECPYHGWRFDGGGACRHVPALVGSPEGKARRVPAYATREQQGYVWVFAQPDATPVGEPFSFPHVGERRYATVRFQRRLDSTVYNALENALDVPHTAFLHRGLFRGGERHRVTARVMRTADAVVSEYVGEPRPGGLLARLLAPGGGVLTHFDRFLLPSIAQVEYALGEHAHLVLTNVLTPETDFTLRMYAMGVLRLRFGASLAARLLAPLAKLVVGQDAAILRAQTATTRAFGGERFVSTEVDVLGPEIVRLLNRAARGEAGSAETSFEVELMA